MKNKDVIEAVIKQTLITYKMGKFTFAMEVMTSASSALQRLVGGIRVNEQFPDISTKMSGSPTRYDACPMAVEKLREEMTAIIHAIEMSRLKFVQELYGNGGGLTIKDDEHYEVKNEADGVNFTYELLTELKDPDTPFEDHKVLEEAFQKYVEAKKYLYDTVYQEYAPLKAVQEKGPDIHEKVNFPLTAYFLAAIRKEDIQHTIEFFTILGKEGKIPELFEKIRKVINENKEEDMEDETEILRELANDGAFCGRIYSCGDEIKAEIIRKKSPKLGDFLDAVREFQEAEDKEPSGDEWEDLI